MSLKRIAIILLSLVVMTGQTQTANSTDLKPTYAATTTYDFQTVSTIDVCLDLGYFININSTNDIKVYQDSTHGGDPFMTYYGCGQIDVLATFPAIIRGTAVGTSPAGGHWSVTLNNETDLAVSKGTTSVVICVLGTQVQTQLLIASHAQANVPVAEITIQITPQ